MQTNIARSGFIQSNSADWQTVVYWWFCNSAYQLQRLVEKFQSSIRLITSGIDAVRSNMTLSWLWAYLCDVLVWANLIGLFLAHLRTCDLEHERKLFKSLIYMIPEWFALWMAQNHSWLWDFIHYLFVWTTCSIVILNEILACLLFY